MQDSHIQSSRVRRTVDDLVLAEMFLLQATIESATAIGSGINDLVTAVDEGEERSLGSVLQHTAGQALEPYTSRLKVFREIRQHRD